MKHLFLTLLMLITLTINVKSQTKFEEPFRYENNKQLVDSISAINGQSSYTIVDSINLIKTLNNFKKSPSIVLNVNGWTVGQFGGIQTSYTLINGSNKRIKGYNIVATFKNSKGNLCKDANGVIYLRKSIQCSIMPGPSQNDNCYTLKEKFKKCSVEMSMNTPSFLCPDAASMEIKMIKIIYYDGSSKIFTDKLLKDVVHYENKWFDSELNPLRTFNDMFFYSSSVFSSNFNK